MAPQIILGTGGFGVTWTSESLAELSAVLKESNISRIDTAALYPPTSPGTAELLLGEAKYGEAFTIDTKIMYNMQGGGGTMVVPEVEKSVEKSIKSLDIPKVNVLYVQGPDRSTPIADQAANVDAQYKQGRFDKFGVCNISLDTLREWMDIASKNGYVKPSVYQGQYNLLCRGYEDELLPFLRENDIAFVAFGPLASGFLTGKLTFSRGKEDLEGTRLEPGNIMGMGVYYWYDKPSMHDAIKKMDVACKEHSVSLADASLRWLFYHSKVGEGKEDGIIIGPRDVEQLGKYMKAIQAGALDDSLVETLSSLWEGVKEDGKIILMY